MAWLQRSWNGRRVGGVGVFDGLVVACLTLTIFEFYILNGQAYCVSIRNPGAAP
jgi:hypothetical protein